MRAQGGFDISVYFLICTIVIVPEYTEACIIFLRDLIHIVQHDFKTTQRKTPAIDRYQNMIGDKNCIAGCDIEPRCTVNNDVIIFSANFLEMTAQDFFAVTAGKGLFNNFSNVGSDGIRSRLGIGASPAIAGMMTSRISNRELL